MGGRGVSKHGYLGSESGKICKWSSAAVLAIGSFFNGRNGCVYLWQRSLQAAVTGSSRDALKGWGSCLLTCSSFPGKGDLFQLGHSLLVLSHAYREMG